MRQGGKIRQVGQSTTTLHRKWNNKPQQARQIDQSIHLLEAAQSAHDRVADALVCAGDDVDARSHSELLEFDETDESEAIHRQSEFLIMQ